MKLQRQYREDPCILHPVSPMVTFYIVMVQYQTRNLTLIQYVYSSESSNHRHRLMLPSVQQSRYRTSLSTQRAPSYMTVVSFVHLPQSQARTNAYSVSVALNFPERHINGTQPLNLAFLIQLNAWRLTHCYYMFVYPSTSYSIQLFPYWAMNKHQAFVYKFCIW